MSLNTDNIRLVFGLKLKQLRIDKGMSLTDLAQKSGLSMSYINEIEKGIQEKLNDNLNEPHSSQAIKGDYLPIKEKSHVQ